MSISSHASPFGHDYMAGVFCVVFRARCKRGIVSPMCHPIAKGRYNGSKIRMVLDDDLAIKDNYSDYMWIVFLDEYEFSQYQDSPLYDEIVALVGNDFDIDVKKCGYRLIYDLDLELSNLAMMHGGNLSALKNEHLAIEKNK